MVPDNRQTQHEEAQVFALLRQLDHAAPPLRAETVAARARGGVPEIRWQRWAAGIVLLAGLGGVAYAMPGSRFPEWVRALSGWLGGHPNPSMPDTAPVRPQREAGVAGIAVPAGKALLIVFTTPAAESEVRISLSDGAEVVVRGPQEAATYRSDVDRLVIDNRGPAAVFEIEIPRSAPRVEVRVSQDRIYLKEGEHAFPSSSPSGRYAKSLGARP